ncbi:Ferredoxin--NADP reductase [Candidatus Terasakiella magnetica]|uniref:Ferredoxin--NADP reductase n=1 Tax=Candidatus Terasakiella magnetica TaxID=1867952 RepID=A0A1C3RE78_9PROT|nr:NAD(P)/FAD-dependent oxidoreductase [Candidatus Terasakiella magnetica]SCA55597.1 Ferredoxin--NADP reductase [Candidatus Terasakiella magnetica]
MSEIQKTDVVVIGAGPTGLFAVFECGMLKMQCHVIDALDMIGGQCTALYPEKPIYDIPAHPSITGGELINKLEEQAAPFDPVYHLSQQVTKLEKQDDGSFELETNKGTKINAKAVIIAAGVGAFGPNRPPLEGLLQYEGTSVFYMVRKREDFRDKRVVIAGGGDSAVDWALSLADVAKSVQVVHRRPKFRAAPESVSQMKQLDEDGKIELVVPYQLEGLKGEGDQISAVVVKDFDGNTRDLEADILLPFYGLSQNLGPIADWGLELEKKHLNVDPTTMQTSEEGVFAVGDIITYQNKLKLILCGFSEAAMAARAAHAYAHPGEELHFEYSTSMGVPSE